MVRFNIELYNDTKLFIYAVLMNTFYQHINNILYLKHMTFFKLLSTESQETILFWFQQYQASAEATEDPLDFMIYLCSLQNSVGFNAVCNEVTTMRNKLLTDSSYSGVFDDNIYYFVKCYSRDDNKEKEYSVFNGTIFHALAYSESNYTDILYDVIFAQIFKSACDYDNASFKSISAEIENRFSNDIHKASHYKSALVCLMVYYVYQAYNRKPGNFSWKYIIKLIKNQNCEGMSEVFEGCFINV